MKKQYIVPSVETVNVRLIGSVLDSANMGNDSYESGEIGAKESAVVEEEEALPTQPNLWNDDEE